MWKRDCNRAETTEIESVTYEDFNVNNVTGYSNYIDEYGSGRDGFRIVICDINSPDTLCDNVHDQTTYRGIALGDSKEQVVLKKECFWLNLTVHNNIPGYSYYRHPYLLFYFTEDGQVQVFDV